MADSPFNSAPSAAWLGAFQLKNTGHNPVAMGERVEPVTEVLPFYLLPLAEHRYEGLPNIVNRGDGTLITVPDGQLWAIEAASATVILPAGMTAPDGAGVRVDFRRTPAPAQVSTTIASTWEPAVPVTAAMVSFVAGVQLPRLLYLGPGSGIAARLNTTLPAPGASVSIAVSYYRIPL